MNSIPQEQNEPRQLDKLAAQRYLYAQAKRYFNGQNLVYFLLPLLVSPLLAGDEKTAGLVASASILITIGDITLLTPHQRSLKADAARIQELFDCEVLRLPQCELNNKHIPDVERIETLARQFKRKDKDGTGYETLKDWYPAAFGQLPLPLARLACQRCNVRYDMQLRRRYANMLTIVLVVITMFVVTIAIYANFSVTYLLLTLVTLVPAWKLGITQVLEQRRTAESLEELKQFAENLWDDALKHNLSEKRLRDRSRLLQDRILTHRISSPLVPDWIYSRWRKTSEGEMNVGAEFLVEAALKTLD